MIIDFHTHAFNEKIADKAISKLEGIIGYKAFTKGTVKDNSEKFENWGISKAVLHSIATKPSQQEIINNWAASIQSENIIPFGSVHPDAPDALDELDRIKALGLKGVKLHPDYQDFFINDEKLYPIYEKCAKLELPVTFHAGLDVMSPNLVHCTPEMARQAYEKVPEMTMILAHLGGNEMWEDVLNILAGIKGNLYFDTSLTYEACDDELMLKIIKKHGADKILYGSDCPWKKPTDEIGKIENLQLSFEEKELILYKNAQRLLRI